TKKAALEHNLEVVRTEGRLMRLTRPAGFGRKLDELAQREATLHEDIRFATSELDVVAGDVAAARRECEQYLQGIARRQAQAVLGELRQQRDHLLAQLVAVIAPILGRVVAAEQTYGAWYGAGDRPFPVGHLLNELVGEAQAALGTGDDQPGEAVATDS